MRKIQTTPLLTLAALAVALLPYAADSGPCTAQPAARDLLVSSYVDSLLNRPKGEDTNFFIRSGGGIPNIMLLLDNSGSMNRLPPDGPFWSGTLPPSGVVGCGLDTRSDDADFTGSAMYKAVSARVFSPPCGNATDASLVNKVYQGHATDYGDQARVCPHIIPGNNTGTDDPGFDPDYYPTSSTDTGTNTAPKFFGKDLIIHDNPDRGSSSYNRTSNQRGDGFNYTRVWPHMQSNTVKSTIATFCAAQGTTAQGGSTRSAICTKCLTDKGWYYDGNIDNGSEYSRDYPSIWYTGNYLNFFPPKFLVARKVLKDIISAQKRIRMAIATFGSGGARFIQPFNPGCDHPETSNFFANRKTYADSIDAVTFDPSQTTPLSTALFEIGRYYHSPSTTWWGASCPNGGANTGDAPKCSDATPNSKFAICYSCQASTVIVLTDGVPSSTDGASLPSGGLTTAQATTDNILAGDSTTGIKGISDTVCPNSLCTHFGNYKDYLAKVAFYLNKMDLRDNKEETSDCLKNSGRQGIDTYTLGFGTTGLADANTILANAAEAGGGRFVAADNTTTLKQGFNDILEVINGRSTSFSVATVSTLQTTSGRTVIVPRFDPAVGALWEGHLYRYDLYSEFVNLCTPGGDGDFNCDGRCDGVFLQDRLGNFISEDGNGNFVQNSPTNQPTCEQAPACTSSKCGTGGSGAAESYWDAADAWGDNFDAAKQSWKTRNVWTVVDSGTPGNGVLDSTDKMVKLDTSDTIAANDLLPYLGLGGGTVCNGLSARLNQAGDTVGAASVASSQVECARTIMRYVLGADLFNERAKKTGFPVANQEDLWDRPFLLGDVFHSSPVVVKAPAPRTGILTQLGLENQALVSLWDSPTPGGGAGWDEYQQADNYVNRRQVALVGGNDGMVHAFSDSIFCSGKDDNRTSDLDESTLGGYYEPRTDKSLTKCDKANVNTELWGFIPPDLLPKLPFLIGSEHHFFVDGSPMVRDIWKDGTSNAGVTGTGTKDGIKEGNEFHTVAVFGERRGGTRHFALDLTDATEPGTAPAFLWIYPQPNDPEGLTFGETYNDYLPTPPPIGPVRIAAGSDFPKFDGVSPEYTYDGSNTPYHEFWVIILNGGFDPQYARGRGVHMVDVWTGTELFDFSYPTGVVAADDPRKQLRFPIASPVGMMRWGTSEKMPDRFETKDNFFDTATFGDTGGQIWTLRFHVPGVLGADRKVTNWYGARTFQMGSTSSSCQLCGGQPFFQITSNGPTPADRVFRTYLGTGDRFNLTDKHGGTCGPSNLRACALRGCTVTLSKDSNLLSAPGAGYSKSGLAAAGDCLSLTLDHLAGAAPITACAIDGRLKVDITNCPSPEPNNGPKATSWEAQVSCVEMTDGYRCQRTVDSPGTVLPLSDTTDAPDLGNWFFSIRVFRDGTAADPLSKPVFVTAAEAKTYDAHRTWVTQSGATRGSSTGMVLIDSSAAAPATLASEQSAGWGMYYNHEGTITVTTSTGDTQVEVSWMDERTGSGTALTSGLVAWNTVQPALSIVSSATDPTAPSGKFCDVSMCKAQDRRVNYLYGADPVSGGISSRFLGASGSAVRSVASYRLVPAQALQSTVFINKKGQVQTALTGVSPEQGATNVGASEAEDPIAETDVLLIDEQLYQCRDAIVDGVTTFPVCK